MLATGDAVAGYRIERMLARGGMGVVYLATQVSLDRQVALKVIAPELAESAEFRERFARESRLAAALDHPNVVPVHEAGEHEGVVYLAMRYVAGTDLATLIRAHVRLAPAHAVHIVAQVAFALHAAHERGLVHRDVKPQNVLLTGPEGHEHAYLTDFGLTKRPETRAGLTTTGGWVGTLDYIAPEQLRDGPLDGRADVYALGCTLYEALAGRVPFRRESEVATLMAHLSDPPPPLAATVPEVPPELDAVVLRALAKDPDERWGSALELASAARAAVGTGTVVAPAPARPVPLGGPPIPGDAVTQAATGVADAPAAVAGPGPGMSRPARSTGGVRRMVTLLYVELASSGADGPLDPEALEALQARCHAAAEPVVAAHGGRLESSFGAELTAVFGLPTLHEDDALRAVRAAVELHDRLAAMTQERPIRPAARVGVSTGEILARDPLTRLGMTGEPVRLAARLARAAAPGQTLISEVTQSLVSDFIRTEPVDGAPVGVPVWRVVELEDPTSVVEHGEAPLVGRDDELAQLLQAFDRTVRLSRCHLFTLLGPAGIGKSRLAEAFASGVDERATVLVGRCLSYGEGITFWPLVEVVRQAFGEDPEPRIVELLPDDSYAPVIGQRVAQAIGRSDKPGGGEDLLWAVRRVFEALSAERPLVLVFEDVHWAEPTFLDLVEHVAEWSRDVPIFLLCLAREELLESRSSWGGGKHSSSSLFLEPLSPDASDALIAKLARVTAPAGAGLARIRRAAEGNPLFIEQMLAMRDEEGGTSASVPPTIHALLAARLDRLPDEEREVLAHASVIGTEFGPDAVLALSPGWSEGEVAAAMRSLVGRGLLRSLGGRPSAGGDSLRFGHGLVRDVAYGGMPKADRARLHERFATWLEDVTGERGDEYEAILGYHLEQAHGYVTELAPPDEHSRELASRGGRRLAAAGRQALRRSDMPAARNLLERAVALLAPDDPVRHGALLDLAVAARETGAVGRAESVLAELVEAARRNGDRLLEARALVERAFVRLYAESAVTNAENAEVARSAIAVFEEEGSELGLARAWALLSQVHVAECRFGEAAGMLERALEHAERAGDQREEAEAVFLLGVALRWGPAPAETAIRRAEEMLERFEGNPSVEGGLLYVLAFSHARRGRFVAARELCKRARATLEDLGLSMKVAGSTQVSGMVELLAGEPTAAERQLREGYEALAEGGGSQLLPTSAALLAEALLAQERDEEAERFVAVAQATASPDDLDAQIRWRNVSARLGARAGRAGEAERTARAAVELAARTDSVELQGDAALALADALRAAGRPEAAADACREAQALYEAKGNLVSAERAASALALVTEDAVRATR